MRAQYRLKNRKRSWDDVAAPSRTDIEALAAAAVHGADPDLRRRAEGVAIVVREMPDEKILDDLGVDDPYELLGCFDGASDGAPLQSLEANKMYLFRRPIIDMWAETQVALGALVADVVVHELNRVEAPGEPLGPTPSAEAERALHLG